MTTARKSHTALLYYSLLALFIGAHIYLSIVLAPPANARLGLSSQGVSILRISLLLLYWPAWYFGIKSALSLYQYGESIKQSEPKKKKGLRFIGHGILFLVGGLATAAVVGSLRNIVDIASPFTKWLTLAVNYIYIVFPLLGLGFIFSGGKLLSGPALSSRGLRDNLIIAVFLSTVTTALYAFLVFTNPLRSESADPLVRSTYYLPDWAILLTIVVPAFVVWFIGMLAAFQIDRFSLPTFSAVQHKAKRLLVTGIWAVIFSNIFLQTTLALGPRLLEFGLAFILLDIYGLILLLTLAYFLVMRGARGLNIIEERERESGLRNINR